MMSLTDFLPNLMKMDYVLSESIIGRKVGAAAEPFPVILSEKPKIGMN